MKVKFIFVPRLYTNKKPYYPPAHGLLPPLGIAILKSTLEKNNYKVDIDDLDIKVVRHNQTSKEDKRIPIELFDDKELVKKYFNGKFPELEEEAEKILSMTNIKGYDVIGLSLLGDSNFSVISVAMILAKLIKEKTGSIIVIGGLSSPRPLIELEEFLGKKYIDFIIPYYGDTPLLNLLNAIENKQLAKVLIDGILTNNRNYKPKKNAKRQKITFNQKNFMLPSFDGLSLDLYRYYPNNKTKKKDSVLMLPYLFIRGCLNGCLFCPSSADTFFLANKPTIVANDLEKLSGKYKTRYFYFVNTHINPSMNYVDKLHKEFKNQDLNILWTDCANFRFLNNALLEKLKEMGAVRLVYGLESASDRMLKMINKEITVRKAESLLRKAHKLGIWNEVELVPGLPFETDKDINSTVRFMGRNKDIINFFYLNRYILMDGSLYQKYPKKHGLKNIRSLSNTIYEMQQFTRCFDEVGGLRWVDKIRQINNSFEVLDSKMREINNRKNISYNSFVDTPLLFYLYSKLGNKREIEDYFRNLQKID